MSAKEMFEKLGNYIKQLEEENKKLKDKVLDLSNYLSLYSSEETMLKEIENLKARIDKAIEYIEGHIIEDSEYENYMQCEREEKEDLLKILKGEENESN